MQSYQCYIFHNDCTSTLTYEIYSELVYLGDTHIVRELRLTMIIFLECTVTSLINHEKKDMSRNYDSHQMALVTGREQSSCIIIYD